MKELVGYCKKCEKEIYCIDGFLNGLIQEDSSMICFKCNEEMEPIKR
ncbi:hypothetical protein J2Z66_004344 [Paenibacillus eucommiae]|uniref:Uncharacterized protein n=1 Tax=Paenibacillus eucommiae TaxID=1355755 RepID=A0ABS4J0G1_9BACL|nr:hypothetical protein [Paenibacillus eucommiae]